jgi:hypothetical protein
MYGKTVTIELDHSDFDLTELMEIFKGLTIASGFEISSWNNVIKELSAQIHEDETEDLKEKLNEWKNEDDENEYKDLRHSFGNWVSDTDMGEDYDGQFKDWDNETPIQDDAPFKEFGDEDDEVIDDEEASNKRMDIIGQNGNEGTHYGFDWDDTYEGETHAILTNINDSIQIIKDRMEDIDLRMDNIDEQLGILNADVANIELSIAFPPPNEHILKAKDLYDRAVKASERDKERRNDYVDMESGEVSYDEDGGFNSPLYKKVKRALNTPVTEKKMNKSVIKRGKIKDLKK